MSSRRPRKSRADERLAKERRKGLLQFGIAGAVIIAFGAFYFSAISGQRSLDPETLCPEEPASITVLLVDVTDPMNRPQQQDFLNQLARLKNSMPRYGQLSVMRVDSTGSNLLAPVITRCSPGTAQDTDEIKGNPAKIQRQWESGFSKPLDRAFAGLVRANGASESPIMESVQSVALTEFQKAGREGIAKRLVIASDLLQNTDAISFYDTVPASDDFLRSDAFRRVRTDLRGVDVELWQLQRLDASTTQPRALSALWEAAIGEQGGAIERLYNVSG